MLNNYNSKHNIIYRFLSLTIISTVLFNAPVMASIMTLYSSKAFPYHQFTVAADFKSVRKCVVDAAYVNATSTYTDIATIIGYEERYSDLARCAGELTPEK